MVSLAYFQINILVSILSFTGVTESLLADNSSSISFYVTTTYFPLTLITTSSNFTSSSREFGSKKFRKERKESLGRVEDLVL